MRVAAALALAATLIIPSAALAEDPSAAPSEAPSAAPSEAPLRLVDVEAMTIEEVVTCLTELNKIMEAETDWADIADAPEPAVAALQLWGLYESAEKLDNIVFYQEYGDARLEERGCPERRPEALAQWEAMLERWKVEGAR